MFGLKMSLNPKYCIKSFTSSSITEIYARERGNRKSGGKEADKDFYRHLDKLHKKESVLLLWPLNCLALNTSGNKSSACSPSHAEDSVICPVTCQEYGCAVERIVPYCRLHASAASQRWLPRAVRESSYRFWILLRSDLSTFSSGLSDFHTRLQTITISSGRSDLNPSVQWCLILFIRFSKPSMLSGLHILIWFPHVTVSSDWSPSLHQSYKVFGSCCRFLQENRNLNSLCTAPHPRFFDHHTVSVHRFS